MSKGDRREREAVSLLHDAGIATYRPATVQYGENDVFGLFDVIAFAPDYPLTGIQVKSNRATGIRAWSRHTSLFRRMGFRTEYWVPYDNQGWRVIEAYENGHTDLYDGRESDRDMGVELVEYLEWLRSEHES